MKGISLHALAITVAAHNSAQARRCLLHLISYVISIMFLAAVPRITRQGWEFGLVCKCFRSEAISSATCGLAVGTWLLHVQAKALV